MSYNIEKADISNLEEIFNLQKNADLLLISYDALKNDLNDTNKLYFIIKNENHNIIAFIGISLLVDHIDIDGIFVKKTYRKKHIASLLLEHVIKHCKNNNISDVFLEVRISNKPAIMLYEKFDFKKIHTRKNYYPDNKEDALIYTLKI